MESTWRCLLDLKAKNLITFNVSPNYLKDQINLWYQKSADTSRDISSEFSSVKINPQNISNAQSTNADISSSSDYYGAWPWEKKSSSSEEGVVRQLTYNQGLEQSLPVVTSFMELNNSTKSLSAYSFVSSKQNTSINIEEAREETCSLLGNVVSPSPTSTSCTNNSIEEAPEISSKSLTKLSNSPTDVIPCKNGKASSIVKTSLVRSFSLNDLSSFETDQFSQSIESYFNEKLLQSMEITSLEKKPEKSQSIETSQSMEMSQLRDMSVISQVSEKPQSMERSHFIEKFLSLERSHCVEQPQSMERSQSVERSQSMERSQFLENFTSEITDDAESLVSDDFQIISSTPAIRKTPPIRGASPIILKENKSPILLDDSDDTKLEDFFKELRLESTKKKEKATRTISRKSLSVFIVSDSEEIEEEDSDEEIENRHLLTNINIPESPLPRIRVTNSSPGSCFTPIFRPCGTPTVYPSPLVTPSSCKSVSRNRLLMSQELFSMFNETVFENKLPVDMKVSWNKRLKTTAGWCVYKGNECNPTCMIELSNKVCDTYDRIRDTLIHEMCHAANWVIDGVRNAKHGRLWKKWAHKAMMIHPDLPPITTKHSYEISYKYTYQCTVCDYRIGRHSKSVNLSVARCPYCSSLLTLF